VSSDSLYEEVNSVGSSNFFKEFYSYLPFSEFKSSAQLIFIYFFKADPPPPPKTNKGAKKNFVKKMTPAQIFK